MRERLSTSLGVKRLEGVLSGSIFSGPDDCRGCGEFPL